MIGVPRWWAQWSVDPALYLIVAAGFLYAWAYRRRVMPGSMKGNRWGTPQWRAASFYCGLLALVIALGSPIDAYADRLFWVHMGQHVLIMTVAAPLLVIGAPWLIPLRFLPRRAQGRVAHSVARSGWASPLRSTAKVLGAPVAALVLFNLDVAVWHVPWLYDLTLRDNAVHYFEHATFLVFGILFWLQIFDSPPLRSELSPFGRVVFLTIASVTSWVLAVVLIYAPSALYPAYAAMSHRPGGISAVTDQQLAGGMMLGPGSVAFAIGLFCWLYRWLGTQEEPETVDAAIMARQAPRSTPGRTAQD